MARRSPDTSPSAVDLESLQDDLRRLNDEIAELRRSIDALFELFDHAVLNGRVQYVVDPAEPPALVTSMALDATAEDFQLNTVTPEELDQLRATDDDDTPSPSPPSSDSTDSQRPSQQGNLFDS